MKTITELVAEANELKKRAGALQAALQEIEEAQNAPKNLVDMGKMMKRAAASKIAGHILTEKNDPAVNEAYLTLLVSLANTNAPAKGSNNSLEYPCRIATALTSPPDMELILKKSIILDEFSIADYTGILHEHTVNEAFVLDGLLMTAYYDKGNMEKIEYLAELAALLGISQNKMGDFLKLLDAILSKTFAYIACSHVDSVLPFVKANCPGFIIDSPQHFIVQGDSKYNIPPNLMTHIQKIESHHKVSFNHVRLKGLKTPIFFSNINELSISDCTFLNFNHRVFTSENVAYITIYSSTFKDCVRDESNYLDAMSKGYETYMEHKKVSGMSRMTKLDGGVLGSINKAKALTICDTKFSNCAVKFAEKIARGRFALFEDTFDTNVNVKSCKEENSGPIYFEIR